MLHGFLVLLTKHALIGTNEASSDKVIPSEDIPVQDLPEKNGNFGPSFDFPYFGPAGIGLVLRVDYEMISFFDGLHSFGFVAPSENVSTISSVNATLLNVLP